MASVAATGGHEQTRRAWLPALTRTSMQKRRVRASHSRPPHLHCLCQHSSCEVTAARVQRSLRACDRCRCLCSSRLLERRGRRSGCRLLHRCRPCSCPLCRRVCLHTCPETCCSPSVLSSLILSPFLFSRAMVNWKTITSMAHTHHSADLRIINSKCSLCRREMHVSTEQ